MTPSDLDAGRKDCRKMKWKLMSRTVAFTVLTLAISGSVVRGESMNLIDFSKDSRVEWYVVNDGVMGGMSQSAIRRTEQGTGVFEGELSLENNGGFASVRALIETRDLSAAEGLEIRVHGDGRSYQLRLRTDGRMDGIAYRAEFATEEGRWITIRLPFEEFLPTFRGRVLDDVPALDTTRIEQVSFLLADKNPGRFYL